MDQATETDPIARFFERLARAGPVPAFGGATTTIRFDVTGGDAGVAHWHLRIRAGEVTVQRDEAGAEAVVRIGRGDLAALVTGRLNSQVAVLRGLLTCTGSMSGLFMFQRCLPGPPGSAAKVAPVTGQEMMARRGQG